MDHVLQNEIELQRMKNIVSSLSHDRWKLPVGSWQVGTLLWHLSFWDKFTMERLQIWKKKGILPPVPDTENIDAINSAFREISRNLDLKSSAPLILEISDQTDSYVKFLENSDIEKLRELGRERWFMRHTHRKEHLDQIELSLKLDQR